MSLRLGVRQEAAHQAIADKFVAAHKGEVMKALKDMIVPNGHLRERLDAAEMSSPPALRVIG